MISTIKDVLAGKQPSFKRTRSSKWSTVRKNFLLEHSSCAVCGSVKKLEVHHIQAYHTHPELELDTTNLITLCERQKYGINCHLLIGHLGNFRNINPNVVEDAKVWNRKLTAPPTQSPQHETHLDSPTQTIQ